jgi:hypothetical protein
LSDDDRHYCRRCREKLKAPTSNPRSAFCSQGCFRMFFEKRCLVCEEAKSNHRRLICSRPACRTEYAALKRHGVRGVFLEAETAIPSGGSGHSDDRSANPEKIGVCEPVEAAPKWRQVAGPALTPEQLKLVTVGVAVARWVPPKPTPGNSALIGPTDAPINIVGGYRWPSAKVVEVVPAGALKRDASSQAKSTPEEATP